MAALLAEGLSNAGLAERLYISPRTAAVHVSNILAKLGMALAHRGGGVGRAGGPGRRRARPPRLTCILLATQGDGMPYIEGRVVHDADAHIMEEPTWLVDHADPDVREKLRPNVELGPRPR